MKKNGKLIIEIGLKFEDSKVELKKLKDCLRTFDEGPRKNLHLNIAEFFSEVNKDLGSIIADEPFMCSIKDPDDPEEEYPIEET